jgi:ribosome-associated protein
VKYIELNAFVKVNGLANTGGQAKIIIRSGAIKVNNVVETQNKKKLVANDVVEFENTKYIVKEEQLREH